MNRAMGTMLAAALTAGWFGTDATASAMKSTANTPQPKETVSSDPLPLLPPTFPTDRDLLVRSLFTPNSIASQTLSAETRPAFMRATLVASIPHDANTVNPEQSLSMAERIKPDDSMETAEFTLPEPASILLVLTGLIGLTARRQMQRRHAKYT